MAHDALARRMVAELSAHELTASAPSWDGKWLSALLRAAGLPRHSLRLRDTEDVQRDTARRILRGRVAPERLEAEVERIRLQALAARREETAAHRALADAQQERDCWLAVRSMAQQYRGADA